METCLRRKTARHDVAPSDEGSAGDLPEEDAQRLRVQPWAPGRKPHWVRITPDSITGRRIRLADPRQTEGGYL